MMRQDSEPTDGPGTQAARCCRQLPAEVLAALTVKAQTAERLQLLLELLSAAVGSRNYEAATRSFVRHGDCNSSSVRPGQPRHRDERARGDDGSFSQCHVQSENHAGRCHCRGNGGSVRSAADRGCPSASDNPHADSTAHDALARQFNSLALCSMPLTDDGLVVGVLTLERGAEQPFDRGTLEVLEALAAVLGPILDLKRRDARWLGGRATGVALRSQLAKLTDHAMWGSSWRRLRLPRLRRASRWRPAIIA